MFFKSLLQSDKISAFSINLGKTKSASKNHTVYFSQNPEKHFMEIYIIYSIVKHPKSQRNFKIIRAENVIVILTNISLLTNKTYVIVTSKFRLEIVTFIIFFLPFLFFFSIWHLRNVMRIIMNFIWEISLKRFYLVLELVAGIINNKAHQRRRNQDCPDVRNVRYVFHWKFIAFYYYNSFMPNAYTANSIFQNDEFY